MIRSYDCIAAMANFEEVELAMKKYPYTDSTDMIVYENNGKKKNKKPKILLTAVLSALVASIFTAGAFTAGYYYVANKSTLNNSSNITANASTDTATAQNNNSGNNSASLATYQNGKKALTVPEIAAQVGPSVVGVINKAHIQSRKKYYDPYSGRYYYQDDPSDETVEQGSGSGIILSDDGYIVTNQHVIDGASEVSVILNTGEEFDAKIIGQDTKTDLAVLKIDSDKQLTVATLGDSNAVEVGELAVAIGNPMGQEFAGSVTAGIISAVNRTMTIDNRTYNLLQTDAAINSGNSGGALINQYGEVIGINSIKLSSTGVEGMNFAIAISEAKPIIDNLKENGYVIRPYVGIGLSETRYGLFISQVDKNSGAEKAGLKEGDMILAIEGQEVSSTEEINKIRDTKKPGDTLKFKVSRNGENIEVDVTLQENTSDKPKTDDQKAEEEDAQIPNEQYRNSYGGDLSDFFENFFGFGR